MIKRLVNYIKREFRPEVIQFARYIPRGSAYLYYLQWIEVEALGAAEWVAIDGWSNSWTTYDLNEDSLVFDLGGFEGGFTDRIWHRYGCHVFVFEPVPAFADSIRSKFIGNEKISVFDFGLAGTTRRAPLVVDDDASSMFGRGPQIEIQLIEASQFFREQGIASSRFPHIDLMKINIEGGEYELMSHLIERGCIRNIRNVQVQFHNNVPGAGKLMLRLQKQLRKSHYLTYQYPFCWENWRLKR
jgi:FkbM family methyltransferase